MFIKIAIPKKEGVKMTQISYIKLWEILIDKNMNKQDLKTISSVSSASTAKLGER